MALDPLTASLELAKSGADILKSGVQVVGGAQANKGKRIEQQTEAIKALAGIQASKSGAELEREKQKGRQKMIIAITAGVLVLGVVTAFVLTSVKKKK